MKATKIIGLASLVIALSASAQKNQIQNALNGLKYGELDKAKAAIDAADEHPDTKGTPKCYLVKAKTYNAISETKNETYKKLDLDASEKAFNAALNCLKSDKENLYSEEARPLLIFNANRIYNIAGASMNTDEFEKSKRLYNLIPEAFAFDKDKSLERNNITKETITFNKYLVARKANDVAGMKENLQTLIDIKYKNPIIYSDMANIYFKLDKDTVKGLSYVEQGRNLFEDNMVLIEKEIEIYEKQKKTDVLIEKINKAIEVTPDNEILHASLGNIYERKGQKDKAEACYKKAIEVKPDYLDANYNLGVMYYNEGAEWGKKANELPPSQLSKAAEYDKKTEEAFKKSMPYLEKAYEIDSKDAGLKSTLEKIYRNLGETEKLTKLKGTAK